MKKLMKWLFWLSIPCIFVGYFLQTILIPIADFETLTKAEIKADQLEFAINYPLGIFMLYVGLAILIVSSFYLVIAKLNLL